MKNKNQVYTKNTIDIISIIISIVALLLSVYANINSQTREESEKNRTIRIQLTDVLGRINNLNLENARIFKDYSEADPEYASRISAILNQENVSLLWQAKYLSEQIPDLISVVDLNTIAYANFLANNILEAEGFHKKSIEKAKNNNDNYSRALTTRSYAIFLFSTGRSTEGRRQYETSVTLLESLPIKGNSDVIPSTIGYTYQQRAISELSIGEIENAKKYFNKAESEFNKMENSFVKNTYLRSLNDLKYKNSIK